MSIDTFIVLQFLPLHFEKKNPQKYSLNDTIKSP